MATVAENQNESETTAPANNTPVASAPQVAAETATKEAPKAPVTPEVQGANSEKAATENSNKTLEEQAKTPQKRSASRLYRCQTRADGHIEASDGHHRRLQQFG